MTSSNLLPRCLLDRMYSLARNHTCTAFSPTSSEQFSQSGWEVVSQAIVLSKSRNETWTHNSFFFFFLIYFMYFGLLWVFFFKLFYFIFIFFKIYLLIYFYFCLHWVFVAVCGLSLVAARGGCSSLPSLGFSLWWLLLLQSTGCRHTGFSSCGMWAQ